MIFKLDDKHKKDQYRYRLFRHGGDEYEVVQDCPEFRKDVLRAIEKLDASGDKVTRKSIVNELIPETVGYAGNLDTLEEDLKRKYAKDPEKQQLRLKRFAYNFALKIDRTPGCVGEGVLRKLEEAGSIERDPVHSKPLHPCYHIR